MKYYIVRTELTEWNILWKKPKIYWWWTPKQLREKVTNGQKIDSWSKRNTLYYEENCTKPQETFEHLISGIWMWVSKKLKEALEDYGINEENWIVQFLPIRILDLETKTKEIEWYSIMNVLNILQHTIDLEKSDSHHEYILKGELLEWHDLWTLDPWLWSYALISEKLDNYLKEKGLKVNFTYYKEIEVETQEEEEVYNKYFKEKWIKIWLLTRWLLFWIDWWEGEVDRRYKFSEEPEELWKVLKYLRDEEDQELANFIKNKFNDEEKERLHNVISWKKVIRYRWGLRKIEF